MKTVAAVSKRKMPKVAKRSKKCYACITLHFDQLHLPVCVESPIFFLRKKVRSKRMGMILWKIHRMAQDS